MRHVRGQVPVLRLLLRTRPRLHEWGHEVRQATITNHKTETVTIRGLTLADIRLLANVIEEGSFIGGDQGGPRSRAILRFAKALRTPAMYPRSKIGNITITCGSDDPDSLYIEVKG